MGQAAAAGGGADDDGSTAAAALIAGATVAAAAVAVAARTWNPRRPPPEPAILHQIAPRARAGCRCCELAAGDDGRQQVQLRWVPPRTRTLVSPRAAGSVQRSEVDHTRTANCTGSARPLNRAQG